MKVLFVHNRYQQAGGEDTVVRNQMALLAQNGVEARLFSVSNDEIQGTAKKLRVALELATGSPSARERLAAELKAWRPDVVHVHNFFPLLTTSIYDACVDAKIPVVQTLHNFRVTCANGLLLRQGRPCEDCIQGSPYQSVLHACYRDSRLATLPLAKMIADHRQSDVWNRKVTRFIALSEFSRGKFTASGIRSEKISVLPHFCFPVATPPSNEPRNTALFVGRLSHEKGIHVLLDAWKELSLPIRVIGDGPEKTRVEQAGLPQLTLLNGQTHEQVRQAMAGAKMLIVPSIAYEAAVPMVVIEAMSHGLPVIVPRQGGMPEFVESGRNGMLYDPGSPRSLAEAVRKLDGLLSERGDAIRSACLALYLERATPEAHGRNLIRIYEEAIAI